MTEKLSQKDYELINSYLDQELDRKDVLKFSERMAEVPGIREEIADLMKVKAMVKELPTVAPPRNYILTRAMAEEARPKPWWERLFPVFRTAAAFCALALAFTFFFPLIQAQQSAKKTDSAENAYVEPMAAEEMDYAAPVAKSLSLYDEEIVLEDRNYGEAAEESYHAVMPSFGVRGGNPRMEYLMQQEEDRNSMMQAADSYESAAVPEGYISTEEAAAAQRSMAMKMIFGGGLILCIFALMVLYRQRKKMEIS